MIPDFLVARVVTHPGPWPLEIRLADFQDYDETEIRNFVMVLNALTLTPKLLLVEKDEPRNV